jgi:hypothetical protein
MERPVPSLVTVIVAPFTTAPEVSVMVPCSRAVSVCAMAHKPSTNERNNPVPHAEILFIMVRTPTLVEEFLRFAFSFLKSKTSARDCRFQVRRWQSRHFEGGVCAGTKELGDWKSYLLQNVLLSSDACQGPANSRFVRRGPQHRPTPKMF